MYDDENSRPTLSMFNNREYERRLKQQCLSASVSASPSASASASFSIVRRKPRSPGYDRFIPCRLNNNWQTSFASIPRGATDNAGSPFGKPHHHAEAPSAGAGGGGGGGGGGTATGGGSPDAQGNSSAASASSSGANGGTREPYNYLLRNELLGARFDELRPAADGRGALQTPAAVLSPPVFKYRSPSKQENVDPATCSLSPVSAKSQKLLRSPRKATRKISRIPFKVLDAPELQDDFYLNLVDWSAQNVLSVGLGSCVYLWSACTSQVTRLCDLSSDGNTVTSVSWSERGSLVAVGTQKGYISVWDVAVNKEVTKLTGHVARVGALAWNGDILSSGSRDRHIKQRDTRTPALVSERTLAGHRQEVCGLKWSPDGQCLASGGNDNRLYVWTQHSLSPVQTYSSHLAAVKAIAWSPHQHGLLASGGGTADRCIRFWNTITGQPMQCVDTGSQVCNLAWSKHSSELVSTHGYSQNQILVWKYPSLTQVAKLTGHSYRVLYLALSPDGEAIVTGAGDETLRFWNVFSKTTSHRENKSVLNLYTAVR